MPSQTSPTPADGTQDGTNSKDAGEQTLWRKLELHYLQKRANRYCHTHFQVAESGQTPGGPQPSSLATSWRLWKHSNGKEVLRETAYFKQDSLAATVTSHTGQPSAGAGDASVMPRVVHLHVPLLDQLEMDVLGTLLKEETQAEQLLGSRLVELRLTAAAMSRLLTPAMLAMSLPPLAFRQLRLLHAPLIVWNALSYFTNPAASGAPSTCCSTNPPPQGRLSCIHPFCSSLEELHLDVEPSSIHSPQAACDVVDWLSATFRMTPKLAVVILRLSPPRAVSQSQSAPVPSLPMFATGAALLAESVLSAASISSVQIQADAPVSPQIFALVSRDKHRRVCWGPYVSGHPASQQASISSSCCPASDCSATASSGPETTFGSFQQLPSNTQSVPITCLTQAVYNSANNRPGTRPWTLEASLVLRMPAPKPPPPRTDDSEPIGPLPPHNLTAAMHQEISIGLCSRYGRAVWGMPINQCINSVTLHLLNVHLDKLALSLLALPNLQALHMRTCSKATAAAVPERNPANQALPSGVVQNCTGTQQDVNAVPCCGPNDKRQRCQQPGASACSTDVQPPVSMQPHGTMDIQRRSSAQARGSAAGSFCGTQMVAAPGPGAHMGHTQVTAVVPPMQALSVSAIQPSSFRSAAPALAATASDPARQSCCSALTAAPSCALASQSCCPAVATASACGAARQSCCPAPAAAALRGAISQSCCPAPGTAASQPCCPKPAAAASCGDVNQACCPPSLPANGTTPLLPPSAQAPPRVPANNSNQPSTSAMQALAPGQPTATQTATCCTPASTHFHLHITNAPALTSLVVTADAVCDSSCQSSCIPAESAPQLLIDAALLHRLRSHLPLLRHLHIEGSLQGSLLPLALLTTLQTLTLKHLGTGSVHSAMPAMYLCWLPPGLQQLTLYGACLTDHCSLPNAACAQSAACGCTRLATATCKACGRCGCMGRCIQGAAAGSSPQPNCCSWLLPSLSVLELERCHVQSDIQILGHAAPMLKELVMRDVSSVSQLTAVSRSFPGLTRLAFVTVRSAPRCCDTSMSLDGSPVASMCCTPVPPDATPDCCSDGTASSLADVPQCSLSGLGHPSVVTAPPSRHDSASDCCSIESLCAITGSASAAAAAQAHVLRTLVALQSVELPLMPAVEVDTVAFQLARAPTIRSATFHLRLPHSNSPAPLQMSALGQCSALQRLVLRLMADSGGRMQPHVLSSVRNMMLRLLPNTVVVVEDITL